MDYQIGVEVLERAGASLSEMERILWKNAADLYLMPYDAPDEISSAA